MKPEEREHCIDACLRILNVQLHKEVLKLVIKSVDLVDKTKGECDIKQVLNLKKDDGKTK